MTDTNHEALKKQLEEIGSKLLGELRNEAKVPINHAEGSFGQLQKKYSFRDIQKALKEVPLLYALFERRVQDGVDAEIKNEKSLENMKMKVSERGK